MYILIIKKPFRRANYTYKIKHKINKIIKKLIKRYNFKFKFKIFNKTGV